MNSEAGYAVIVSFQKMHFDASIAGLRPFFIVFSV